MRKVEQQMIDAITNGREFRQGNTVVRAGYRAQRRNEAGKPCFVVFLHGNEIARWWPENEALWVSDGGRQTFTAKSRLNVLLGQFAPGCYIAQRAGGGWELVTPEWPCMHGVLDWKGIAMFSDGHLDNRAWRDNT